MVMTRPPDAQTPTPRTDAVQAKQVYSGGYQEMAEHARQLERELTAERERGRRVREETIEECVKECEHRAFLCHAHNEHGKGREQGLLDAATHIRALSRAESAPADVPTEGGG